VTITDRSIACLSNPVQSSSGIKKVEILVDRTSIELFANDGEVSLSACFRPTDDSLTAECAKGSATIRSLKVFELASIWTAARK
jgi:sucrose-6-phosphate hydrolase SacC (GH32 family)